MFIALHIDLKDTVRSLSYSKVHHVRKQFRSRSTFAQDTVYTTYKQKQCSKGGVLFYQLLKIMGNIEGDH
jgi:hypothetical protein